MTQDEIIRMAREAGFSDIEATALRHFYQAAFTAGAAYERNRHAWTQEHWTEYEHAIAAAEREACIEKCKPYGLTGECVAIAIRARGK